MFVCASCVFARVFRWWCVLSRLCVRSLARLSVGSFVCLCACGVHIVCQVVCQLVVSNVLLDRLFDWFACLFD